MTIDVWLENAIADAERRGLPDLKPLLESLAKTTASLREAEDVLRRTADGSRQEPPTR